MLKDDELIQLTQDHTYVEYLVRTEQISKEEALPPSTPSRNY